MVYKWKPGSRFKISAQAAGERIDEIKNDLGRGIKPEDVVKDARSGRSPLHKAFDWDDSSAAHKHRLSHARGLLASLITIFVDITKPKDEPKTIRAFLPVRDSGESNARTFYPTAQVLSDDEKRHEILQNALTEFRAWRDRYKNLVELAEIFEAGNLVIGRIPRKFKGK